MNSKTVTWESLDAPDQHDRNEEQRTQVLKESQKKLEKPLGMYILNQLESSDEIGQPLFGTRHAFRFSFRRSLPRRQRVS